jgi:hypothetical protein
MLRLESGGLAVVVAQFTYKFEELPLLQFGERLVAGLVDGEALIQYECGPDPDEWTVQRIWLEVAYLPKIGEKGRVEMLEVPAAGPVVRTVEVPGHKLIIRSVPWAMVHTALLEFHSDFITETVRRHLDDAEGAL